MVFCRNYVIENKGLSPLKLINRHLIVHSNAFGERAKLAVNSEKGPNCLVRGSYFSALLNQ